MGSIELFLLLLLSSAALAEEGGSANEQTSGCLAASRLKAYRRYVYRYRTESRNGVEGSVDLRNGPSVSCQVEIEVPQTCRFIMHTRSCDLREASLTDPQGQPVYQETPSSEAFRAAMEKNPLKFTVENVAGAQLYPEADEPVTILNLKRGIISALMAPIMEEEPSSYMNTVHGRCLTVHRGTARKDGATDMTLTRDLSQCDQFYSRDGVHSSLALLQKLNGPMSQLISSSQECNYQFDNKGRQITSASCTERHASFAFPQGDGGMSSVVTQELSFQSSRRTNNRLFDVERSQNRPLHFEDPDHKAPVQSKDAVLSTMQDLLALADTDRAQERAALFHKLVTGLRVLKNDTLSGTVTEMLGLSGWLTWQSLLQCGTSECTSAILQAIRTIDGTSLEVDALVYGLSLLADPDAARVRDMLSMAQYKQSKAIMYALANTVRKFHRGGATPVVTDVSTFMETLLNDCSAETLDSGTEVPSDPEELSFLVLRVVGVMGRALQEVGSSLVSSVLRCAQRADVPLSHQKAAIQALRLMEINEEIRRVLMEVFRNPQSPADKRVAAYLILMKNPDRALLGDILSDLENLRDQQLKSFVVSHLNNIRRSEEPQMSRIREDIQLALDEQLSPSKQGFDGMSQNYKVDSPIGSVRSNVIFDSTDTLPKEMMLETTLRVFDYNYDIFEVGIEGTGFEPTIDALFGEKGFFPDSISKVLYWAGERAEMLRGVLERVAPGRMKREVPQGLLRDISSTVQKLISDLRDYPVPEAMAYLRLFGNEMGYMKSSEMRKLAGDLFRNVHVLTRILPVEAFLALTSSTENQVFAHYIFMENALSLPTSSGLPLKFSMAGVFAAGAKGGLTPSRSKTSLSFTPSVGLEFITQMGVFIPEFLDAGLEMHASVYHQSSASAQVTLDLPQMRLSIPAPKSNIQLLSVSTKLLSVSSGKTHVVASPLEDRIDLGDCRPLFRGLKFCTRAFYFEATSSDSPSSQAPTGETRFAVELQPTGEVSEYSATIRKQTVKERGQLVDSVTLRLKAEGVDSSEVTASLKFNRRKKVVTADVIIPDYEVEAGVKLALTDQDVKGKQMRGVTIDVTNKKVPLLTLVANTRLDLMKDAALQLQMTIPPLRTNASFTASTRRAEGVLMDVEALINLPETSYQQKASLKYDDHKFEVGLKSDVNSDIRKLIPDVEHHHRELQQLIDHILDQRVTMTDMKYRHIVSKGIEAGNLWLDKLTAHLPYLSKLRSRRSLSDLTLPALPEKLFLQTDSLFRYQFNKDKILISLPLPLGGKTSEELNVPSSLDIPVIDLPKIGLYSPANKYRLPSFTIPPSVDLTVPLLGLAEASTRISSNLYSWEGSISGGNTTVDVPSYTARFRTRARSPLHLLSYKLEGTGMISGSAEGNLKYLLNSSFSHNLIDWSVSVSEIFTVDEKMYGRANYKIEVSSPVGLEASYFYSAQSTSTLDSREISGGGTVEGLLRIGPFHTSTSYTQKYRLYPLEGEGRGESTLYLISPFIQVHNTIQGEYANSELNIVSETNTQKDLFSHRAELRYKDEQLIMKSSAVAIAMGKTLNNKVELGVNGHMALLRVESQADDDTNRLFSLVTGSLDSNGLEINSEGSLSFDTSRGLHKASVMVGKKGLTTSGTNSLQNSLITVESVFSGAIDNDGATLSSMTKAMAEDVRGELKIEGKIGAEEASLQGVLKGHAYDGTTANNMKVVLNRRALTLTSNTMGRLKKINADSSHALTLTLWTMSLRSKSNGFICEDTYYKQDTKVDMKPFVVKFDTENHFKLNNVSLSSEGHMKLEPMKVGVSGGFRGAYGEDNIKHTCEINYDTMAATMKISTSGNVMGAQLSHDCELQFAGLSSKSECGTRITSEPLRFDSTVRTLALPFSLRLDALVNSEGEVDLDGRHTGQLYSKLLLKAEPLALAVSHDTRISTTHSLPGGESSTNVDNKFDGLLTPRDQSLTWKVKSKLNNHAYNQDISTYNNPDKTGLEFSGLMSTDFFSKSRTNKSSEPEEEEFRVAGFLQYDKNSHCHVVEIPIIESFPAAFDKLRNSMVGLLESMQQLINTLDINQLVRDFRLTLDRLPMQARDFMHRMDLENQIDQVKTKVDYLINEFSVTMEDLEDGMNSLREKLEKTVIDFAINMRDVVLRVRDYVQTGQLADMISSVLSQLDDQLLALDRRYEIKATLINALDSLADIIRQTDLQKLTVGGAAWLTELDSKYSILENIQNKLLEMKQTIGNFSISMFLQDVRGYLLSVELVQYAEQFLEKIPSSEISSVIESMNDVIVNWIDEYEIPNKLNSLYSYIRDLLLKYSLDDKFKALMDRVVVLINEFKIDESLKTLAEALKPINFEFVYGKMKEFLNTLTGKLRATDFKEVIIYLNEGISWALKSMREFDYSVFVEEANMKIAELTDYYINQQIETYEIVQKIEAVREFFREIQSSVFTYLDKLRNTKVADAASKLLKVMDSTFYNDIRLNVKDMLDDMTQRITDMDVRDEIHIHLQRASESYRNVLAYISAKIDRLMENTREVVKDYEIFSQIKTVVDEVLTTLERGDIEVPAFVVPLTDLLIPAFTINLNKLQEIIIPAHISVPEFSILHSYTVPAFSISFEELKAKIAALIDDIRGFEMQMPDPERIFGELRVLYLYELPDLTFPDITLSEIKFPTITIPSLNLEDFEMTLLPIPDISSPEVPTDICIPAFGKLRGEFRVNSPLYTLVTTAMLENSTSTPKHPQFTATVTSHATSPIELLQHSLEATAQLQSPRMRKLLFTETVKSSHVAFSVDHEGSLTLTSSSVTADAKTKTKATTQMYKGDLVSNMAIRLKSGISASVDTTYSHILDIPSMETSSQVSVKQNVAAAVDSGTITVTGDTTGEGEWSVQDYSDEGTHRSNAVFNISSGTAMLTFVGETDCKALKSKQTLTAEAVVLSHITVEGRCETQAPSVKRSHLVLNGEAHLGDLKVALTASHDAEFYEHLSGSMTNSLEFLAHPFVLVLNVQNSANTKMFFPLKLTGKVDLQQDYGVTLGSEKQAVYWTALARFNQYKYNHNLAAENNDMDIVFHLSAKGEANLDFLTVPLYIPDVTLPYVGIKTPQIRDLSLWEHAGLKTFLTNPQQSFDLNLKLHYYKNPEVHSFELHLEPLYRAISDKANMIQAQFEQHRDKTVALLKDSYNQAKSQYIKQPMDTSSQPPRVFSVPGYKIPLLNIEVSAFRAEIPTFSYFIPKEVSTPSFRVPALGFSVPSYTLLLPSLELPVIHVPETLSYVRLPALSLPSVQNSVTIPAMGNITLDWSFKSSVITVSANAGLYNQSDIVARFGATSTSAFDTLNGKMDGTSTLTGKRGVRLATSVSLEHNNVEAKHECAVSLTKRSIEASLVNTAKINLPFLNLEINQELSGNTKSKPNVAFNENVKYTFYVPLIESVGKGNLDMTWTLEALSSYLSVESSTQGKSHLTIMDSLNVAGYLDNKANCYLNANGLRATMTTALNSKMNKVERQKRSTNNNIFHFELSENLALEVSLRRLFATVDYVSNNNVDIASFSTNGKHVIKGELDLVPLTILTSTLNIDASQPSSFGQTGLTERISLSISPGKQVLTWSGRKQMAHLIQAYDLLVSHDESEVRLDLSGSAEGHLALLKSFKLPVYQKNLWDVLKFDQVTNTDDLQFLNITFSTVYTKSMDGYEFTIPPKLFEHGITFSFPEISISVPSWLKKIPSTLKDTDMGSENPDVPDHLTLPSVFSVPAWSLPFTNLHVDSFTIDLKNFEIPKVITTSAFDITLPGFPRMSVPSYDIRAEYLRGKMSFLWFHMPQHDITVSSFTLPKSFTLGEHTISLDEITNHISNFELPAIVIPQQHIEIPEVSLHLPSSVFIPAFGALSATLKVSSPIYKVSSTASVERKDSSLVASLSSVCISTVIFLEYDLSASATLGYDDGLMNLKGRCSLIHSEVNVDWNHVLTHNLRTKRQTAQAESMLSHHTLNVHITSPTFFDLIFRFASRKDGITASMSSPASGFLGLHLQRRSMSQLYGKLFCRYLSSPEKDTDIFTAKATLRSSQKMLLQTAWNWDVLHDAIEGTKQRVPAMTNAVLQSVNKYHTAHFGFDLTRGGMKLKNTVSNAVERLYHEVPVSFSALQGSVQQLSDGGSDLYRWAADSLSSLRLKNIKDKVAHEARRILKSAEALINVLLDAVSRFLADTKFTVSGSDQQLSSLEILQRARRSVTTAIHRVVQRLESLIEKTSTHIRETELTIPGTQVVVNGNVILDEVQSSMKFLYRQLELSVSRGLDLLNKTFHDLIQMIDEEVQNLVTYLQDENMDISSQIHAVHAEVLESSKRHIEEAKRGVSEYKDLTRLKIQDVYNSLNLERVNNDTTEVIGVLQSHLYGGLNEAVDLLRRTSQKTAPYVKVSNTKMEVEIPLPFLWRSFSEWPKL